MLIILTAVLWLRASIAASECFTPNGTDRNTMFNGINNQYYVPCDNYATHSMCCSSGPSGSGDVCVSGGLCYNAYRNIYWRESCTDPTWQDPACVKLFVNGTGYPGSADSSTGVNNLTDVSITKCEGGSWCYGTGPEGQACCSAGLGVFLAADGTQTSQNPNVTSTTNVADATSATATGATIASTPATESSTSSETDTPYGLSKGAIAGISVGASVGIIAFVATFWFLSRRRKRAQAPEYTRHAGPRSNNIQLDKVPRYSEVSLSSPGYQEMPSSHIGTELDSNTVRTPQRPTEMPA